MSRLAIFALAVYLSVGAFSACVSASEADDKAQKAFEALYGEDFKRATSTRDTAQAVALAAKLFEAAKSAASQPELMALLADKACDLGAMDPKGYDTALAAAALVCEKAPELAGPCQDKIIAVRQKQYEAGRGEEKIKAGEALVDALLASAAAKGRAGETDDANKCLQRALGVARVIKSTKVEAVDLQIRAAAVRQKAQVQATQLKAQVQADPANAKARDELVRLLVVELDDPAEAAKYLDDTSSAAFRKFVPAAAKPLTDAPQVACLELADWYLQLASVAGPAGKGAMFARAKAYAGRFLALHEAEDIDRTRMELVVKKAGAELARPGPAAGGKPKSDPFVLTLDLGKGVSLKLVRIRPGKFIMGSPDSEKGRGKDEGPQHEVTISKPFYMGLTEVTQAQYEAVMGTNPSKFKGPTNPVDRVSLTDASDFCRKLSEKCGRTVRLPTEAEWEYACRAGSKTAFFFGDTDAGLADYAWFANNSAGGTHPVAQKKPNAWGLYDMLGNEKEWCADWYGPYAAGAAVDPKGPASSDSGLRGGGWSGGWYTCRAASRLMQWYDNRSGDFGFRVVVSVAGME